MEKIYINHFIFTKKINKNLDFIFIKNKYIL